MANGCDTAGREPLPRRRGRIFILSAPSGAGKTTLRQAAVARFGNMRYSVSYTTRPPRAGEVNGRDYVFISLAEFKEGIRRGRWAEWAKVHENYYGTSEHILERALAEGCDVLLEIDVQGARQICRRFPESVTIFVMPPSLEVLEERLKSRGTDSPEAIALRLENAKREMGQKDDYRHVIVNDDLETAIQELTAVLESYRQPP
jgi:guanylate kinase